MSENKESFEQLKYDLEKQRLEFERLKYKRDNTFINKNFGVVITALISAATIIVSAAGIKISSNYNAAQLANAKIQSDRGFSFDVAKFLLERREDINTADAVKAGYARNIVIALFPEDLSAQISRRLRDLSGDADVRRVWADGLVYAQSIAAAVPAAMAAQGSREGNTLSAEKVAAAFKQIDQPDRLTALRQLLIEAQESQISGKHDVALFLTAVFSATDFLRLREENLNYSSTLLLTIWPSRFGTLGEATEAAGNPE